MFYYLVNIDQYIYSAVYMQVSTRVGMKKGAQGPLFYVKSISGLFAIAQEA